jgi:hypothetical protein
VVSGASGL